MTDLRTAAQQALEALEYAQQDRECPSTTRQAIAALRAALAQQAEPVQDEPVHDRHGACPTHCCPIHGCKYMHDDCPVVSGAVKPVYPRNNGCESCAEDALAQQAEPAQEPVAWAAVTENGKLYKAASTRESAERKAEQQEAKFGDTWRPLHVVPLYTAPPQREPLPLKTVEKLIYENTKISPNVADDRELLGYIVNAVRAVERAHGIKE